MEKYRDRKKTDSAGFLFLMKHNNCIDLANFA